MRIWSRMIPLAAVLGLAVAVQLGLLAWLEAAGPLPAVDLQRPLTELPKEIAGWVGEDREITDERLSYPDDRLQRVYLLPETQQYLTLWIAYSATGEDRGHHPEVCMSVAGRDEDRTARSTLSLPGHSAPLQQYIYDGGPTAPATRVYYWYYTLEPPPEGADAVQRTYQKLHQRPSSVTLEVFAPETSEGGEAVERFVRELDALMQEFVGPRAERGSDRLPVVVVGGGGIRER